MTKTEQRIAEAARMMAKATSKIGKTDPDMANRLTKALADEMQKIREGR